MMESRLLRVTLICCSIAGLTGCYSASVNVNQAELMPESVARAVVAKYAGADWAEHPYLTSGSPACDNAKKLPIAFGDIKRVDYDDRRVIITNSTFAGETYAIIPLVNMLMVTSILLCSTGHYNVYDISEKEAGELATAITSLGARLSD
jgi:hypothetical protein